MDQFCLGLVLAVYIQLKGPNKNAVDNPHIKILIARGIFCSVKDLDRKIMRDIRSHNRQATPLKWSYKDASNRIKTALELNETVH
jgi:hypothetical protein